MYIDEKLRSAEEQKTLHDKLIDRVYNEGVSIKHISDRTGIGYQSMLNFFHGKHTLNTKHTNSLRKYFSEVGK